MMKRLLKINIKRGVLGEKDMIFHQSYEYFGKCSFNKWDLLKESFEEYNQLHFYS